MKESNVLVSRLFGGWVIGPLLPCQILLVEHGGPLNSKEVGSLHVKQFLLHLCFCCHYVIKQINLGDLLKILQQVPLSCASLSKIFNLSARVLFFDNPIF
jgi:hypothetical protein